LTSNHHHQRFEAFSDSDSCPTPDSTLSSSQTMLYGHFKELYQLGRRKIKELRSKPPDDSRSQKRLAQFSVSVFVVLKS
jgi:hypothetical protein